jgi:hypothetical protein
MAMGGGHRWGRHHRSAVNVSSPHDRLVRRLAPGVPFGEGLKLSAKMMTAIPPEEIGRMMSGDISPRRGPRRGREMTRRRFPPPNGGRRLTRPPGWDGAGPVSCGFGGAPQSRGEIGLRREFPNCISDGAESQAPRMAFARGGMSQYALRHMRFADLLPVPRRQGIPRFVEHGAQELNCFWIVRSTVSHGGSAPQTSPALSGHRASSCFADV